MGIPADIFSALEAFILRNPVRLVELFAITSSRLFHTVSLFAMLTHGLCTKTDFEA